MTCTCVLPVFCAVRRTAPSAPICADHSRRRIAGASRRNEHRNADPQRHLQSGEPRLGRGRNLFQIQAIGQLALRVGRTAQTDANDLLAPGRNGHDRRGHQRLLRRGVDILALYRPATRPTRLAWMTSASSPSLRTVIAVVVDPLAMSTRMGLTWNDPAGTSLAERQSARASQGSGARGGDNRIHAKGQPSCAAWWMSSEVYRCHNRVSVGTHAHALSGGDRAADAVAARRPGERRGRHEHFPG